MAENQDVSKEIANIRASIEKIEDIAPEVIEEMHAEMSSIFKHVTAAALFVAEDPAVSQRFVNWVTGQSGHEADPNPWIEAQRSARMIVHLQDCAEIMMDLITSMNKKKEE